MTRDWHLRRCVSRRFSPIGEYVQADAGSGGAKFGGDAISEGGDTVVYPRIKLIHGADGVNGGDVSDANPLPVDDAGGSLTVDNAGTFPVQVDGAALTSLQLLDNIVAVADGAAGTTPTGVPPLAVRDDALSALTPIEGDFIPFRVDANGALWVIQSGTVAISAASLPLPSGAATSAKQDTMIGHLDGVEALLTAIDGRVDGIEALLAGGLPAALGANGLKIDDGGGSLTIDGTVSVSGLVPGVAATSLGKAEDAVPGDGDTGVMALAIRKDTAATTVGSDGDYHPLEVDGSGRLWVNGSGVTQPVSAASLPLPTGAATSAKQDTIIGHVDGIEALLAGGLPAALAAGGGLKVEGVAGGVAVPISVATIPSHAVTNAGTFAVQVDGNALTALQLIDDPVFADDAAFTVGTSKVFAIGFLGDETSPDLVDEGDAGIARMTLDRQVRVTLGATPVGTNMAIFRSLDLDETEEDVKTSAGNLYGYYFANTNASARYLKFYNATAANTTVGSTTPIMTLYLPPTSAGHISFPVPIPFSTALCAAATTGVADADTGAPGANEVLLLAFYA